MATRPNPHDAFFRQAYTNPQRLAWLLKLVTPAPLLALLDLNPKGIRILDPTHVDAELRGTGSDLVVEVPRRMASGGRPSSAILICAFEHQRRDERFFVVRGLGYTVRIWERWLRNNPGATHLPPIIPIVIYNGDAPWRSPTSLSALIDLPELPVNSPVRSLLPSMDVVLVDLTSPEFARAVLRARADDADAVAETLLEILQGATRADADALLDEWAARLRPLHDEPAGWSTLVAALCYLAQVSAIPKPHLAAASDALPESTKETFMTAAEEWMLEGMEKGREEGERSALASMLTRQVRLRFRDIPPEAVARIEAAHKPELERWIERILTAETLDDLFA